MATGKVKWFNNAKGYGFVLALTGGEDLFVHFSSIQMDGYKTLKAGQLVEFDVQQGPKGLHAVNIRLPESSEGDADGNAAANDAEPATRSVHQTQNEFADSN
ncbi:MAG: cold shock domain-containing protein [Gammaproteobacteria bacterium]|nr:cold shock domain-containing protein [Gammaproteobacteria bacterium]